MATASDDDGLRGRDAFAPLRVPVFARVWSASLFSNFGHLILGVGAAWQMTHLTSDPGKIALVQGALMLPMLLVAMPAGAVADMFDRRAIALIGLGFSIVASTTLTLLAWAGLMTPWTLLAFCTLIGSGVAFYGPAWRSSIPEQVDRRLLPAAVALGSLSYNIARSVGPALGGLIVLAAGAQAAFAINAVGYLPLLFAMYLWRRAPAPSRLPPERIGRAIISGVRYAFHAEAIRTALIRVFVFGLASTASSSLAPLVAKTLLQGDSATFGLLLGAVGIGAVIGALNVARLRERFGAERTLTLTLVVSGLAIMATGISRSTAATIAALLVMGAASIVTISVLNLVVQLASPRWVAARTISLFSSSMSAGLVLGSWLWGEIAADWSVQTALVAAGAMMTLMPLLGLVLPLRPGSDRGVDAIAMVPQPEVALALTLRSGPIAIEAEYRVAPENARSFYEAMLGVQRVRLRNGGFAWSLARDIADPEIWTERYHCPTWGDFLRTRDRLSTGDVAQLTALETLTVPGSPRRVRRQLERPFGSVRWRADSPDPLVEPAPYIAP